MTPDLVHINAAHLAARWWVLVLRGIVAILFGALLLTVPGIGLLTLVLLWAAYALIDGVFSLVLAARSARTGRRWGWLTFEGLLGIAAGVVAFAWPGITALVLLMVIAAWAVLTGIAEIAAAIRLRKVIRGEWLLALGGALSIAFGVLVFLYPGSGALAVMWIIGAYSIVFGVLLVGLGIRLRSWLGAAERATVHVPVGGVHEHRAAT